MTSPEQSHAGTSGARSPVRGSDERIQLSRSPHPYHRRSTSLAGEDVRPHIPDPSIIASRRRPTSSGSSDSGTEADDERGTLLKGLPAPPLRAHKGLRGATPFAQSPAISPLPTPPLLETEVRKAFLEEAKSRDTKQILNLDVRKQAKEKYTRRKRAELVRRFTETSLLLGIGLAVCDASNTTQGLVAWKSELAGFSLVPILLYLTYPFLLSFRYVRKGNLLRQSLRQGFHIPSRFDTGPLIYPVLLPCLVATSLMQQNQSFLLPNLILGLSSIPLRVFPLSHLGSCWSQIQWAVSLAPLAVSRMTNSTPYALKIGEESILHAENLTLLCPLQKTLLPALEYLTTTSLDPSELQLLATALIDLFIFATTPQMQILKALLWLGGTFLFISTSQVLSWEVALARIPGWKFARRKRLPVTFLSKLDYNICQVLSRPLVGKSKQDSSDDDVIERRDTTERRRKPKLNIKVALNGVIGGKARLESLSAVEPAQNGTVNGTDANAPFWINSLRQRRNTFPDLAADAPIAKKTTSTGRSKRSASPTSSSFLALSPAQAVVRKWVYAGYTYLATLAIILGPIRSYVSLYALSSWEPFGWALGYLLGNLPQFRFFVVSNNLERWIALPSRWYDAESAGSLGWVEQLRQFTAGPATTRLLICGYCCAVLLVGLAVVLRLTSVVEVDTRRKVFHGVMVAMLLPTVFVDPCFIALALALILAIFLLLDLFRAAQLPPISRPLTHFLAPYVDGRDHRGPVIVSHIFLLIGCAIPLWLSLAGTERTGADPWAGWDVKQCDVSMISGIVCVGLGDAAASLIGRRYGKTKWYWGGGKSLEGSLAFAVAVTIGLMASYIWLRVGGWVAFEDGSFVLALGKCALAGIGSSLMETTLTAANDNVVVPIGLWLLVRGLRI